MATPVHILGFSGSLRKNSYNTALLRAAAELLPATVTLETFDIAPIPIFNQDQENTPPEPVREFKRRILAADALLIATPEYNFSIPGGLKNAMDWASRPPKENPFNGKPLAIMGASNGQFGTLRAQLHLRQVAQVLNMYPLSRPEVLVFRATEKFDAQGKLTDEMTRQLLQSLLVSLADWTRRLRGESPEAQ